MKIFVKITTHKRPEWCLNLLKDLKQQQREHDIIVNIFHDKCDSDYSEVYKFCQENNWKYFKTKENFGKYKFWQFLNMIYTYQDYVDYDVWISLPDDVVLVDNFFNRCLDLLKINPVVNFFTMQVHLSTYCLLELKAGCWNNNWIDGCFVATKKAMKGLRIDEPHFTKYPQKNRGTGTAHELRKSFNAKGFRIFQTKFALVEHIGNTETVMHDASRRKQIYGERRMSNDPLSSSLTEEDSNYIKSKLC